MIPLMSINIVAFMTFGIDKWKASHNRWRISEAALLGLAFCGGAAGALLAMSLFRHKTHKPRFRYGVPVMLLIQGGILIAFVIKTI